MSEAIRRRHRDGTGNYLGESPCTTPAGHFAPGPGVTQDETMADRGFMFQRFTASDSDFWQFSSSRGYVKLLRDILVELPYHWIQVARPV